MIDRLLAFRFPTVFVIFAVCALLTGCNEPRAGAAEPTTLSVAQPPDSLKPEPKPASDKPAEPKKDAASEKPADKPAPSKPEEARKSAKREPITAENNPTTKAGRGAPDLDKPHSPSAWIFIDGKEGRFKEEAGQPLLQWFIEQPVGATPTFRVEAFEPLLGTPKDFKAVLRTVESVESDDGTDLVYGIAAGDGTFEIGKEYNLLNPGENFVVRNVTTGDVIKEIAPLPSGKYAIAAGILNSSTGKQTLAVTYFTVRSDE